MVHEATQAVSEMRGMDKALRQQATISYRNLERRKQAEKDYFKILLDLEILKATIEDLELYIHSLESSLQVYHKKKIEEVNAIIGTLWERTYRGKDIDRLMVRIDNSGGSAASKKKDYDYRVVFFHRYI